jgi:hypothetical protein
MSGGVDVERLLGLRTAAYVCVRLRRMLSRVTQLQRVAFCVALGLNAVAVVLDSVAAIWSLLGGAYGAARASAAYAAVSAAASWALISLNAVWRVKLETLESARDDQALSTKLKQGLLEKLEAGELELRSELHATRH